MFISKRAAAVETYVRRVQNEVYRVNQGAKTKQGAIAKKQNRPNDLDRRWSAPFYQTSLRFLWATVPCREGSKQRPGLESPRTGTFSGFGNGNA